MPCRLRVVVISIVAVLGVALGHAQSLISPAEARDYVGETTTVCGQVVSTHYAASTRGSPTFINLDRPYPNQVFTVVIWGSDRPKFGSPEKTYRGKRICVTGKISNYKGIPETMTYEPSQIKIQ